jgi:hypothetical protein
VKAYQVFARMTPERTHALLESLREGAPAVYTQALAAASAWLRARPQFVLKQSPDKRAKLVRQALSRFSTSLVAEEVLAAYFLQVKKPLLVEWLDAIGLEHEDGALAADAPPEPPRQARRGRGPRAAARGLRRAERDRLARARGADRRARGLSRGRSSEMFPRPGLAGSDRRRNNSMS